MALRHLVARPVACWHYTRAFATQASKVAKGASVLEAITAVKTGAKAKFDETVEIAVRLGVDPRKPNQNVRSTISLPHGTGKTVRVAAFATEADAEAALAAGADVVGSDELIDQVAKGTIDFDRCVATPSMMAKLGRVARILGPRGLMPNPKLGTVTKDVAKMVKELKGGMVQFRTEKMGIIHAPVGKVSFSEAALKENIRELMVALANCKPESQKGSYIKGVSLCSTMGKGVQIDVTNADPSSPRFMLE